MNSNWPASIAFVLREEGGYSNDLKDLGGETNYGISKRAYPELNIATLSIQDAMDIYRRDYWGGVHGDDLPAGLDIFAFDTAVNCGVASSILFLQTAVNVTSDGIYGPATSTAVKNAGPLALREFAAQRGKHYCANPNAATYGLGWMRRLLTAYDAAHVLMGA